MHDPSSNNSEDPRAASDAAWMIPFFSIIASGIGFFFWQVTQYGLLPH